VLEEEGLLADAKKLLAEAKEELSAHAVGETGNNAAN
jgi:hypothetical protein